MIIFWSIFITAVFTPTIFLFIYAYKLWKDDKELQKDFDKVFRSFREILEEGTRKSRAYIAPLPPQYNPYQTLGVLPFSSIEICENAYRNLAKRYHPDNRETGDIEKMKTVNNAIQEIRKGRAI